MDRKEKDERILWKKNDVVDYAATIFSIFNNALYLVVQIILLFVYVLQKLIHTVNYMRSLARARGSGKFLGLFFTGMKMQLNFIDKVIKYLSKYDSVIFSQ